MLAQTLKMNGKDKNTQKNTQKSTQKSTQNDVYNFLKTNKVVDSRRNDVVGRFMGDGEFSRGDNRVKSNTLDFTYNSLSGFCKIFDDSDVTLRLPYATGRSTFYGRAHGKGWWRLGEWFSGGWVFVNALIR